MNPIVIPAVQETDFSQSTPIGAPVGPVVAHTRVAHHQVIEGQNVSTGVWECSVGKFKRQVVQAEYSYFVKGAGSFTPDDGVPVEFNAGDAIYFAANTQGVWEIREPVLKTYLIIG